MKIKYYTCDGDVRGCCGIRHRSIGVAAMCCVKDHRDAIARRRAGDEAAYSDRGPVFVFEDGTRQRQRLRAK